MLRILGNETSINARKVLWTCVELGAPFELEFWGGAHEPPDTPGFRVLNPNAMAPVLIDGDVVLWESNAICRYLAASRGRGDLLPSAPARRALVEQWMDWQATDLNTSWRYAFQALIRKNPAFAKPAAIEASVAAWNRHMAILDDRLAETGAFVTGETFTLADVVLGLSANRWRETLQARPTLPAVSAWLGRLEDRPGFVRYGPGTP